MTGQRYNSGKDDQLSFRVERRELRELLGLLKDGQSVHVTGGRKLGKTVLLEQTKKHFQFQGSDAIPMSIPLYQDLKVLTRPVTAAPFFYALSRKVPPAVNAFLKGLDVEPKCQPAPNAWKNDPSLEFCHYLNEVLDYLDDAIGRTTFIYLLDECEQLLGSKDTHTLTGNLRALIGSETDNRVRLVITGFRDLKEYEDPETGTSPFKNLLLPLPLGLFQEDEFDKLVCPLLETVSDNNRSVLRDHLWAVTGGHPSVIQVICSLLITGQLSFDAACAQATKLLEGMAFGSWVDRFTAPDHDLFRKAVNGAGAPDESPLSVEFLQYCGVLRVCDDKLLAPCGLFNKWYQGHHKPADRLPAPERLSGPVEASGNRLSQEAKPMGAGGILSDGSLPARGLGDASCALIMKGGGVKGLALVGALLELEKYYEFTAYVGTSAGAIVAGLLATECSAEHLENVLRRTNFRRFQDGRWHLRVKNLLLHFYLNPGREFENWLWEQVREYNRRTWQLKAPLMGDIKRRLTIYAAQEGEGTVVFDSRSADGNKTAPLTFAIRCSMSIPVFFKPPMHNGKPIYDGGLLENFPAERWLRDNPGHEFIGIYLGRKVLNPSGSASTIGQVLNTIIDKNDATFIDSHRDRIIVVDPDPVQTTDFDLSEFEAEFLVLQGRADALEHLYHFLPPHRRPSEEEVQAAREQAEAAKVKAIRARKRRKKIVLAQRVLAVAILGIILVLTFIRFGLPLIRSILMSGN